MEWLSFIPDMNFWHSLLVALIACYVLFFFFGKKEELSENAAHNTLATVVVAILNIGAIIFFLRDINAFAQRAYNTLGIPTVDPAIWDNVPVLLVCIVIIAAKDFCDYWCHRAMHTRWGWPAHAAHHSDSHVNAFTGLRVHFLEGFLMFVYYTVLLTWLQLPELIPPVIVIMNLFLMYQHMDLPFKHGPLKYLIASPVFHRWHHADTAEAYGKNLAGVMPLWDKLFGTYYEVDAIGDVPMGALKAGINDTNPFKIYVYPFQEWGRLIKEALSNRTKPTTQRNAGDE